MTGWAAAYRAAVRRLLAPVVVALLLVTAACSDADDEGSASDDTTTTVAPDPGDDDPAGGDPGTADGPALTVLDAGAEPRAELRYAIAPGSTSRFATTTTIDQEIDGVRPGAITTTIEIDVNVLEATAEQTTFTATFGPPAVETEPGTPEEITDAAAQGAELLAGAVATITIDSRGDVLDVGIELGEQPTSPIGQVTDELLDGLLASLEQQSVVFPAEAVGVGARWQSDVAVETAGVATRTQQEFTVVAIDEAGVDLAFTTTGTIGDTGTTSGAGTMRVAFGSFYPTMESESTNEIALDEGTIVQTITQSIRAA